MTVHSIKHSRCCSTRPFVLLGDKSLNHPGRKPPNGQLTPFFHDPLQVQFTTAGDLSPIRSIQFKFLHQFCDRSPFWRRRSEQARYSPRSSIRFSSRAFLLMGNFQTHLDPPVRGRIGKPPPSPLVDCDPAYFLLICSFGHRHLRRIDVPPEKAHTQWGARDDLSLFCPFFSLLSSGAWWQTEVYSERNFRIYK